MCCSNSIVVLAVVVVVAGKIPILKGITCTRGYPMSPYVVVICIDTRLVSIRSPGYIGALKCLIQNQFKIVCKPPQYVVYSLWLLNSSNHVHTLTYNDTSSTLK